VAIVEGVSSDRGVVAGDLLLIDRVSGNIHRVNTRGVDVTYTEWSSDRLLIVAGHRGFETVVARYDVATGEFVNLWVSDEISGAGRYITISAFKETDDFVLVAESFMRAPEIAVVRRGKYDLVKSFGLGGVQDVGVIGAVEQVMWKAPDGLEIQGWLLRPKANAPHPLVMVIHGGPVWHWHPTWLGRSRDVYALMLLKRGYALFYPNPRGSSGRGQAFARLVWGDVGGADTTDFLSGIDHLLEKGVADANRLGVTGGSYGGFMTSWLVTQDSRFTAAVSVAPVTNQTSAHLISNIPHFVALSLADHYTNACGKYFERSPIMHAHKVKTPTLNICGALDHCTPPEEAIQFHNALLENGVRSVLVTYPEEGHGVRRWPAAIDYAARVVGWFEEHIPPREGNAVE